MNTRLSDAAFKNSFVEHFPGDFSDNPEPRQTPAVAFSTVKPSPVPQPQLLSWSAPLAKTLGLKQPSLEDVEVLAGNKVTLSMRPYAAAYGGHQFGHWAGQLGDGRAITLGEIVDPQKISWDIQLKGAGLTAYSRNADGLAVLRSSLREYIASEALFHLGVPTTRALALVSTGSGVLRDMFYDGNAQREPGAIVTRVAPSFLRFGNFELPASRNEIELLQKLIDWTVKISGFDSYEPWFFDICKKTAELMSEWLRVGFVHGVMNTDNMSILGLTIDFGPYGFLDNYDPQWTPNTTDLPGRRYCYGNQPSIALWNLARLAEALETALGSKVDFNKGLDLYRATFEASYLKMRANKLGLSQIEDFDFLNSLDTLMQKQEADFTLFYYQLGQIEQFKAEELQNTFYNPNDLTVLQDWLKAYQQKLESDPLTPQERQRKLKRTNPIYIPRNWLLLDVIKKTEDKDLSALQDYEELLTAPYQLNNKYPPHFQKRPDWAKEKPGASQLSCSS